VGDGTAANANQGNEIASYAYDPFGRRIKKTVIQAITPDSRVGTTVYFYSDEGLMAEVDGSSGNVLTTYGWMLNETWGTSPVFKRDFVGQGSVEHYYHVDHIGTAERLTNQAGEITWRSYSEAFGKTTVDTSVTPTTTAATINNLRFPGQYEDAETNTRYNYFRDYDSVTGRYVESDPIGLVAGVNTYTYVEANPLTAFDPTGEIAPIVGIYARCVGSCMLQRCLIDAITGDCTPCADNLGDCLTDCLNPLNWGPRNVAKKKPRRPPKRCEVLNKRIHDVCDSAGKDCGRLWVCLDLRIIRERACPSSPGDAAGHNDQIKQVWNKLKSNSCIQGDRKPPRTL
jgi:RHS repeat-associated protein